LKGDGVKQNVTRASELYRRGCDGGEPRGCAQLGLLYFQGYGVHQELARAVELFKRGCDGGDLDGCANLGTCYDHGLGVEKNAARAFELFTSACNGGKQFACTFLAFIYDDGKGVKRDIERAIGLYQRACDAGDALACTSLGVHYAQGSGVEKKAALANELFSKGCEGGDPPGCTNLGVSYANGIGVNHDPARASELYKKGCVGGDHHGCESLRSLKDRLGGVEDIRGAGSTRAGSVAPRPGQGRDRSRAYGQDFSIPLPPGFKVARDRDSMGSGPEVSVVSDTPAQEWTVVRGPPLDGGMTQEHCQEILSRHIEELKRSGNVLRTTQAIATPPGLCRYRIVLTDRRELRVFIAADWIRSFITSCITGPDANPNESCTTLTDGFEAFAATAVRVAEFSVPVPTGYVLGYMDNAQWPDTLLLTAVETPAHGIHRGIQIQVLPAGSSITSCEAAAARSARDSHADLVTASDGAPAFSCRARLRSEIHGVRGQAELRWRRIGARDILVSCTMDEGDEKSEKICDETAASIAVPK
jgi:TPR repeat protein